MPAARNLSPALGDLIAVIAVALSVFLLGTYFDFAEHWQQVSRTHEGWELDEFALALAVSSVGFGWYAYRRWREATHQANRRTQMNRELAAEIERRLIIETTLRDSENRFRSLFDTVSAGIGQTAISDGRALMANPKLADIFGYASVEEFLAEFVSTNHIASPGSRARLLDHYQENTGDPIEYTFRKKDGTEIILESHAIVDHANGVIDFVAIDITDRKRAETEAARAVEMSLQRDRLAELVNERTSELQTITDNLPALIAHFDKDLRYRFINATAATWYNRPVDDVIGMTFIEVLGEDTYQTYGPLLTKALAAEVQKFEPTVTYPDGKTREIDVTFVPDFAPDGSVQGLFSLAVDISSRKQAERARAESEARFRAIAETSPALTVINSLKDGTFRYANKAALDYLERTTEDLSQLTARELWTDRQHWERYKRELGEKRRVDYLQESFKCPNGQIRTVLMSSQVMTFEGEEVVLTSAADITERQELEEQLRQAQKMEVLGQLTGGIAHDFNNLLAVIIGNLELLADAAGNNRSVVQYADRAAAAADRGAKLTHRLLAYSRRQTLHVSDTDINQLVRSLADMVSRSVGELITLKLDLTDDLPLIKVDPHQLENAILNLAVNARDAMPEGGTLTISSDRVDLDAETIIAGQAVAAGTYLRLTVTDIGSGMAPNVRERVFEPFYTTKDVGEGSGLGLSMVHGFVKQSGGEVTVESTIGQGTSIGLYLPIAGAAEIVDYLQHPPKSAMGAN